MVLNHQHGVRSGLAADLVLNGQHGDRLSVDDRSGVVEGEHGLRGFAGATRGFKGLPRVRHNVKVAESAGGAGQQECPHPVGGADTGDRLRPRTCAPRPAVQAARASSAATGLTLTLQLYFADPVRRGKAQVRPAAGEPDNPSVASAVRLANNDERMGPG